MEAIVFLAQGKPPTTVTGDLCPAATLILQNLNLIVPAIARLIAAISLVLILHLILATIPNYKL